MEIKERFNPVLMLNHLHEAERIIKRAIKGAKKGQYAWARHCCGSAEEQLLHAKSLSYRPKPSYPYPSIDCGIDLPY